MKFYAHLAAMLLSGGIAFAQTPQAVMIVKDKPVSKVEFERFYQKSKSVDGMDNISVDAFANLFADYKLKVQAALDAHLDTTTSYRQKVRCCKTEQESPLIRRPRVDDEAKAYFREGQRYADNSEGYVKTAQILLRLGQKASDKEQQTVKDRIDSIYRALVHGADFVELARKYSEDGDACRRNGSLPWLTKGQTVKAFENVAFSLKKGEISKPFLSEYGYHIVKLLDRQEYCSYDSVKDEIQRFLDARNLRENIVKIDTKSAANDTGNYKNEQLDDLPQDIREEFLVEEISRKEVWNKAVGDERGLIAYYSKNKKKYKGVLALLKKSKGKKERVGFNDVRDLVIADYQDLLEKQWVAELREKYKVVVFSNVLATISNNNIKRDI